MHQVSIEEAKTTLPDLIEAAVGGDEVRIAKDDQHIVRLVPVCRIEASAAIRQRQRADHDG